jgi:hypothetical protein
VSSRSAPPPRARAGSCAAPRQPALRLLDPAELEGGAQRQVRPGRRDPLGEDLGQHALGGGQPSGQPVSGRHLVADDRAEQLVLLGQMTEGVLGEPLPAFGVTAQPGQVGAGDGERGRHVGQHAVLAVDRPPVRLVADASESPLRDGQQRLDLVEPAGHERDVGLPQGQQRATADHLGRQRGEPRDQGGALGAAPDLLLQVRADELGRPRRVAGRQRVPSRHPRFVGRTAETAGPPRE